MVDRESTFETERGDDGFGAGMAGAIAVIVLLMIAGCYLFFTHTGSSTYVTIDVPKVTATAKN